MNLIAPRLSGSSPIWVRAAAQAATFPASPAPEPTVLRPEQVLNLPTLYAEQCVLLLCHGLERRGDNLAPAIDSSRDLTAADNTQTSQPTPAPKTS